jgi:hypothetical protein
MARETKAQRNSRVSALLADYDARSRELNKLMTIVKGLKEQVRELDSDTYGDWTLTYGTPRSIMDQAAARKRLTDAGIEIPMVDTQAPINVTPKVR